MPSIELHNELGNDLTKIFERSDKNVMPFMSLFWQLQKKLFQSSLTGDGVASHALAFLICGMCMELKFCLAYNFCNYWNYSCTIITTVLGGSLHFGTNL